MNRFNSGPTAIAFLMIVLMSAGVRFGTTPVFAEQAPQDPVEALRTALQAPVEDIQKELQARRHELEKCVKALRPADLGPALRLQEWRDEDSKETIAVVDRAAREAIEKRFAGLLRDLLVKGDDTDRQAAATQIGEMGVSVRATGSQSNLARSFTSDLVAALKDREGSVRVAAVRALGKVNPAPNAVMAGLADTLSADEVGLRRAGAGALVALVRTGDDRARDRALTGIEAPLSETVETGRQVLPVAARGLGNGDAVVRKTCLESIKASANLLTNLVASPPYGIVVTPGRRPVARENGNVEAYLKHVADEQAMLRPFAMSLAKQVPAVTRTLDDTDLAVRLAACEALEAIPPGRRQLLYKASTVGPADAKGPGKEAADALGAAMRQTVPKVAALTTHKDVRVRLGALYVLEELEGDAAPAADALVKCLADRDPFVRWAAVRALGKMAPKEPAKAVPGLAKTLADENGDVRVTAVAALGRFGASAKEAVPALAKVAQGDEAEMRVLAIQALGGVGPEGKPAVPALIAALSAPEVEVRAEAARALGKLGPAARPALEALRKALDDPAEEVRQAASEAVLAIK